jgi:hypothetical protein
MNSLSNILSVRCLSVLTVLLLFFTTSSGGYPTRSTDKDGKLVVLVTYGDTDNTPAINVYVEASGFMPKDGSRRSFVLNSAQAGRYEMSIPPGVYDVFVSEGTSEPRCRRMLISPGLTSTWTLKLEVDEIFTQR